VSNPMLEPRRLVVAAAVAFAALALAAADPARGEVSVSDEQADASAVVAETLDAVRFATPDLGTKAGDATTLVTADWLDNESMAWFPAIEEEGVARDADDDSPAAHLLTLAPSPMRTPGLTKQMVAQQPEIIPHEHAVIPLPSAAWTGLAGLASLATIGGRKALLRFFCT